MDGAAKVIVGAEGSDGGRDHTIKNSAQKQARVVRGNRYPSKEEFLCVNSS